MNELSGAETTTLIFCDGACSGNPGKGGWGAVVVLPGGEVIELGGPANPTTNNRMELAGAIHALKKVAKNPAPVWLYTDSVYVIKGITLWIHGWRRRGWKTAEGEDVANKELWQELALVAEARPKGGAIDWRFVKGHSGVAGNERVDQIAVAFTQGRRIDLYNGPLIKYQVPIYDLPKSHALPAPKEPGEKKAPAYSYVSVVDGVPMRHQTWPECEARVKGRSGAKFKKSTSEANEQEILAGWGFEL